MPVRNLCRAMLAALVIIVAGPTGGARAEQITIKMWMHEHPPRLPIDRAIIAEFEKANPDVKIDYVVIAASEYATKLLTAFASGSGPDLFNQSVTLVSQYYNARILAPIDYAAMGYADEAALTGKYVGGFDGIRFAGKLYGVPPRSATTRVTPTMRSGNKPASTPPATSRKPGRRFRQSPRN